MKGGKMADMEFGMLGPMGRAKWAEEKCFHVKEVCASCAAEAIAKTIDQGIKLAGGVNEQALKLLDAGEAAFQDLKESLARMCENMRVMTGYPKDNAGWNAACEEMASRIRFTKSAKSEVGKGHVCGPGLTGE